MWENALFEVLVGTFNILVPKFLFISKHQRNIARIVQLVEFNL